MAATRLATLIAERVLGPELTTSEAAVSAVRQAHTALEEIISLVIGKLGFEATFARCVSKTRAAYPFLAEVRAGGPAGVADRLWPRLEALPLADIRGVSVALFACFFELMTTLIGADLTLQLFRKAWPDAGLDALES